jgi:hypothetical protein
MTMVHGPPVWWGAAGEDAYLDPLWVLRWKIAGSPCLPASLAAGGEQKEVVLQGPLIDVNGAFSVSLASSALLSVSGRSSGGSTSPRSSGRLSPRSGGGGGGSGGAMRFAALSRDGRFVVYSDESRKTVKGAVDLGGARASAVFPKGQFFCSLFRPVLMCVLVQRPEARIRNCISSLQRSCVLPLLRPER